METERDRKREGAEHNADTVCRALIVSEFHSRCNCNQWGVILAICRGDI